jgi:acyl-CoA synthetase (AMP-forming)/AMP-acid ligase II
MIIGPTLKGLDEMDWVGDYPALGAALSPERPAIIVPELGVSITYAEFDRRTGRAAAVLADHGLGPGSRVAYLGKNSDHFYVLLSAAIRRGVVVVPINWRCVTGEIAYFLNDSAAPLMFCDAEFSATAEAAAATLPTPPLILPTERDRDGQPGLRQLLEEPGPMADDPVPHDDAVCLHLYTSGTTGRPKGTLCTHRAVSIARKVERVNPDFPQWTGETVVSAMPHFHIGGISWMLTGLARRSTCVLTPDASAANLVQLMNQYGAISTFAVPTVIRGIVETVRASGTKLPSLRHIYYGAAPIGAKLLNDAMTVLGCGFGQHFGMTEITGSATFLGPAFHDLERPGLMNSVGRALPGVGYWNRPDATAEALKDGWYRTGDGGRLDADGFLYLTDRIKDMIVSGGENVYPAEVEEALRRHPAVLDAAVIGLPDERWGESVTAIVECRPGETLADGELLAFMRQQVAGYKCPKRVELVLALPRTASGKIQRARAKLDLLERLAAEATP